ncbi:MAG: MBL fold metallo-hydrolase [Pseudomonadota bacterium]
MTVEGRYQTVADKWYEVHAISDDISLIRETHVATWLRCNIWHVRGRDRDLLIDSGMGVLPLKAEVAQLTEKPVIAVSSHAHFDHIGCAHEFDCRLGHKSEAHIHAAPEEYNTGGWDAFVRAETFLAAPYEGFEASHYTVKAAPLTGYLDEGDVVDLGDRQFAIFHLPGHSPGSIALYETKTKTLFSGDVVYNNDLFDTVYHSDRAVYRESLQRLRELPVDVVHGGHYDSMGPDRMREIIDGYMEGRFRLDDPEAWVSARL